MILPPINSDLFHQNYNTVNQIIQEDFGCRDYSRQPQQDYFILSTLIVSGRISHASSLFVARKPTCPFVA